MKTRYRHAGGRVYHIHLNAAVKQTDFWLISQRIHAIQTKLVKKHIIKGLFLLLQVLAADAPSCSVQGHADIII